MAAASSLTCLAISSNALRGPSASRGSSCTGNGNGNGTARNDTDASYNINIATIATPIARDYKNGNNKNKNKNNNSNNNNNNNKEAAAPKPFSSLLFHLSRPEYFGEVSRDDPAEEHVGVGHRQVTRLAVTHRPGVRTRALWSAHRRRRRPRRRPSQCGVCIRTPRGCREGRRGKGGRHVSSQDNGHGGRLRGDEGMRGGRGGREASSLRSFKWNPHANDRHS